MPPVGRIPESKVSGDRHDQQYRIGRQQLSERDYPTLHFSDQPSANALSTSPLTSEFAYGRSCERNSAQR